MQLRSVLLPAALWLLVVCRCGAAELVFGFYSAPAKVFTKEEAATLPKDGKADVAAVLKLRGFDMPEGSSAFYDAAAAQIFLRSTQRDLNHLARIIEQIAPAGAAESGGKQVQVTAVCYAIPVSAVPADFGPQSSLKSLPQDKLTVVDRASLICRGGQRSKIDTSRDSEKKPAGGEERPTADRTFEYEVTVGEDGTTLDVNMAWLIRTSKLAPEGQAGEFKVTTQILSTHGATVMQELGVTDEAEPRLVLLTLDFAVLPAVVPVKTQPAEVPGK